MIRRFLAFLRRLNRKALPTRIQFDFAPLCRVQTDLTNTVRLHAGDMLHIQRAEVGFCVVALVLREWQLQEWPLFHCATLREAYDLRGVVEEALRDGAVACNPRARLQRELARRVQQEVAF